MTLIEAIQENDKKEFFELLSLQVNSSGKKIVDEVDTEFEGNALYWAAACGRLHFIAPLIKAGADVNKPDNRGWTPVYAAANSGHAEIIIALKAGGADVNTPNDSGTTPVCVAAYEGHAKVITALKAAGADVNATEINGLTPIYIAVQMGDMPVINALLEAGVNVSTKTPHGTPLELAKQSTTQKGQGIGRLLEAHLQQYLNGINYEQCWSSNPEIRPTAAELSKVMTTDVKTLEEASHHPAAKILTPAAVFHFQANPASPNNVLKRRDSVKLNLADKKDEQEKMRYVLEELKTFFLEAREEGERTESYAIYNEYLKKANSEAQLVYKLKQNKHVLYVNDEPLDAETAVKELSRMLKSLMVASIPQRPIALEVSQPVVNNPAPINASQAALKLNLPEQKNTSEPVMLSQFQGFIKPSLQASKSSSQVSASNLTAFLRFVVEGEQEKAEAMLKSNPTLALVSGDITDLSKRPFTTITGFQYAVWALDWHMWTMIRKYLPDHAAQEQAQRFETGSWVKKHGEHVNWKNLLEAQQTLIKSWNTWDWEKRIQHFVKSIGKEQLMLPIHMLQEYTQENRPYASNCNFSKNYGLKRNLPDWLMKDGCLNEELGIKFGCVGLGGFSASVYKFELPKFFPWATQNVDDYIVASILPTDQNVLNSLFEIRIKQRKEIIDSLVLPNFSAVFPVAKVNSLDQKSVLEPAMLSQFQEFTKPSSQVSASDLTKFLRFVAEGEQDKAEAMLKSNPNLALVPGDVTDLSKRTFNGITGFQYAVWALDWHMWTMIRKYLAPEEAHLQAQEFERGSWVKSHGVHANLNILIQAYQTTSDLYKASKYDEGNTAWVQQVGGAQRLLPAHVINEYCHPTRPFYPSPNFKDAVALPRSRTIDEGEWLTASYNGGKLGERFGVLRGTGVSCGCVVRAAGGGAPLSFLDQESVTLLTSIRTAQREALIAELRPKNVQRKVV